MYMRCCRRWCNLLCVHYSYPHNRLNILACTRISITCSSLIHSLTHPNHRSPHHHNTTANHIDHITHDPPVFHPARNKPPHLHLNPAADARAFRRAQSRQNVVVATSPQTVAYGTSTGSGSAGICGTAGVSINGLIGGVGGGGGGMSKVSLIDSPQSLKKVQVNTYDHTTMRERGG